MPLRCSPLTLDVILDTEHRITAGVGAARSMKTHTGGYKSLRQWGLRGEAAATGWFLGPELDRAFILVEKWCDGEGENPPICPPELIVERPSSKKVVDPTIIMLDGFRWQVKHTGHQGRNLTGRDVRIIWWTEAATTQSPMDFVRVRGRIVQSKGTCYLDAVPEARSWVKTSILDAAIAEREDAAEAAKRGESYDTTFRVVELSSRGNPWVDEAEAIAFRRDLDRIDPRIAAREAGGEWVGDHSMLYEFDESRISFDPMGADPLAFLDLEDCTRQASLRWFALEHDWIISGDINARPHTSLIGKIAVKKGQSPRDERNWIAVFLDHLQVFGLDSEQAAEELAAYRDGRYRGAAFIIDATSTQQRHNAGGALNTRKQIIPREAFELAGFEVRGPERQTSHPSLFKNPGCIDSALVTRKLLRERRALFDRTTCRAVLTALRNQEAEADGVTPLKRSDTNQDRYVAAFTDCFRYWTYPFFALPKHLRAGNPLAIQEFG